MTAYILLSAGIGRSMKTKGNRSLLSYDGVSVLTHQTRTIFRADPNADIYLVLGFQSQKVTKKILDEDIRIIYNPEYETNNQADSLKLAMNAIRTTDVFVIHGDIIFNERAIKKTKRSHVVRDTNPSKRKMGMCYGHNLVNLSYGLENIWGQIAYVSKADFQMLKKILNSVKPNKTTAEILNLMNKEVQFGINSDPDIRIVEISKEYEDPSDNESEGL
jgi:choline kinase